MKTVVVVGVGALGSHLVQFIRNCEAKIRVIDFDRIEQKNVMSQFHARNSVGKGKAQALGQLMQFLFNVKIETVPHKLVKENVEQLLGKSDLIVDCLDNAEARILVQEYARKNKVACLHGALAADGMFGRVVWDESFTIDGDAAGAATCEDGEHLPFIGQTATILAKAVQIFLDSDQKVGYHVHPAGAVRI
jgi:molybdopterin/thiamine biosynthesis adenylyltransferase